MGNDLTISTAASSHGGRAHADFQQGVDGQPRLAWAKSEGGFNGVWGAGGSNPYLRYPGQRASREAAAAADIGNALLTSNPDIATLVEGLATHAIGTGLTPSAKLDPVALNITPDQARDLEATFNKGWAAWAGNPLECDLAGRHTFHALATAGFKSYLLNGELLATVDWQQCPGAQTRTKVALLDPRQCDRTKNATERDGGTWSGVAFNAAGRVRGYWLRKVVAGSLNVETMPAYVPAFTAWGRPKVIMLWDLALPGQVRGLSPLTAALTPAHEGNALQEFTLAAALIGTAYAMTIESDLPAGEALRRMEAGTPFSPAAWEEAHATYYGHVKVDPKPGTINHLSPGDKLKINKAEAPAGNYEAFNSGLQRRTAKAAGGMVEDLTGDYSKTSFSASRMASELPHRINLRRRAQIVERFYQLVRTAWLEEQIETGLIALPPSAPAFWQAPHLYSVCKWNGLGRVSPDPKKAAEADVLMLENHLTTHTDILAERGLDFDELVAKRKYETEALREAGLLGEPTDPGAVTTQVRDQKVEPPDAGEH